VTKQVQPGGSTAQLTLFSPAKINLYLRILGKRPDGYHALETVMLPLEFGDEITLALAATGLTLECDHPDLSSDDSNIALRAANLLAEHCGVDHGATIVLRKRTPLAAGLGGGSSNAAAVLSGLNRLWNPCASNETLHELAARLGSDVNFFLGSGAALCRGRGERIEPITCRFTATILLVNPGFGISTKWAYENWAKAAAESRLTGKCPEVSLLVRALAEDDLAGVAQCLFNSLEIPSVRKFPVLGLIKKAMCESGAAGALMSGSGASLFGLFANRDDAERCARQIREQFGPSMWTAITRSADASEREARRKTAR
jgi:4-diphosphocytidyl-2-C-methyl-D-erythritol kinase